MKAGPLRGTHGLKEDESVKYEESPGVAGELGNRTGRLCSQQKRRGAQCIPHSKTTRKDHNWRAGVELCGFSEHK